MLQPYFQDDIRVYIEGGKVLGQESRPLGKATSVPLLRDEGMP